MNFFRGLNKEQWSALGAVAWSAILLLLGFGGGAPPVTEFPRGGAEEPYVPQRQRYVELPDEKFDRYWNGKPIFNVEVAGKPPIPLLKAPDPREEQMPAPAFRPGPQWETYNHLAVPVKYPLVGTPLVAEANLPTAAEIGELVKIEEPVVAPRVDKRGTKEREIAILHLKSGTKVEATVITGIYPDLITIKDKVGRNVRYPRADVLQVDTNYTYEKKYQMESEGLQKYGPQEPEERLKLAQRSIELGMIPEARAELKRALEVRKDYLEAIVLLGELDVEDGNFEGAIATYRTGLDAGAPAGELWYEIARCLRAIHFAEGALQAFEKAVENQPRLHRARIALSRALLEAGQAQAAVDAATDFFTKLGNSPDTTPQMKGEALTARGLALVRTGQFDKARADFAEAIKIDGQNAEALNGNGAAFAAEGQFPQAGPEFVKAIRANQYLTEAWTNLATLCLLGTKWADAEALAVAAAQRDPASVEAVLIQALAQLLAGKKDAPQTIALAEKVDPRNLEVLMVSGLFLLRQGQDEEALGKFVSALRQEYFYLPAYTGASAAYLRTARKLALVRDDPSAKKAAELRISAATLLQAVQKIDPGRPGIWLALGGAYAVMQRPDEARLALRQATENDPLVSYTRGYIEYYYAEGDDVTRLSLAEREFEQGAKLEIPPTDGFGKRVVDDCKLALDEIDWWKRTSVELLEDFNPPESKNVGGSWIVEQGQGLLVTKDVSKEKGGRGKIAGKQSTKDWLLTSLLHDVSGDNFSSFEITFFPEKVDKAEFGLALFHTHQGQLLSGFCVGVDTAGKVRYAANAQSRDLEKTDMSVGWTEIKTPLPPNPKELTIKVTAGDKNRARVFSIWYWNAAKSEWLLAKADIPVNPPKGQWRVGAWTHAWRDQDVLLYVDSIKVLSQSRR